MAVMPAMGAMVMGTVVMMVPSNRSRMPLYIDSCLPTVSVPVVAMVGNAVRVLGLPLLAVCLPLLTPISKIEVACFLGGGCPTFCTSDVTASHKLFDVGQVVVGVGTLYTGADVALTTNVFE